MAIEGRSALNRLFLVFIFAFTLIGCQSSDSQPAMDDSSVFNKKLSSQELYPIRFVNREKFDPQFKPAYVEAPAGFSPRTIVVDTKRKLLYLVDKGGMARRYGVAVGASGHAWHGYAVVGRKQKWPAWYPTDDMHRQVAGLPRRIEPGPENPLGARALYLYANGKDTLYRIHGTSEPWTIGTEASSGCIRMFNEDVIDLYERVEQGYAVVVL